MLANIFLVFNFISFSPFFLLFIILSTILLTFLSKSIEDFSKYFSSVFFFFFLFTEGFNPFFICTILQLYYIFISKSTYYVKKSPVFGSFLTDTCYLICNFMLPFYSKKIFKRLSNFDIIFVFLVV